MFGSYSSSKCWKNVRVVINESNDDNEEEIDDEVNEE